MFITGMKEKGQVIVLLHGTGASLHTWDKWTEELKKTLELLD